MKIIIKPAEGPQIIIPLPTRFVFSGLSGHIIKKSLQAAKLEEGERIPAIPYEVLPLAGRDLLQMRKDFPGLPLVEVESSDGDHVTIYP